MSRRGAKVKLISQPMGRKVEKAGANYVICSSLLLFPFVSRPHLLFRPPLMETDTVRNVERRPTSSGTSGFIRNVRYLLI